MHVTILMWCKIERPLVGGCRRSVLREWYGGLLILSTWRGAEHVQCLLQGHYCEHGSIHEGLHDSDSIIPPSNRGPPHSNVPYMSFNRVPKGPPFEYSLGRPSRDRSGEGRSGSLGEDRSSSQVSLQQNQTVAESC